MHVVKLPAYHRNTSRALEYVRYIAHREEHLPAGERRELYGIGDRYKEVSQAHVDPRDRERALKRLMKEDAKLFPQRFERGGVARGGPIFHRPIFTVDERAARILASLPPEKAERAVREAFQKALRSSAVGRQRQGVYTIHWHGGHDRIAHPHVHALFSPARTNGQPNYIGPKQLASLKQGWNRAVEQMLVRLQRVPEPPLHRFARTALGIARIIARPERLPVQLAARVSGGLAAGRALSLAASFARAPGRTAAAIALDATLSRIPALGIIVRGVRVLDLVRRR
jgi:hypothetical protein